MCWLECNFLCCFIISRFCAKSAINSSCLWCYLLELLFGLNIWASPWTGVLSWGHGLRQEPRTCSPQAEQNYKRVLFPQSLPTVCEEDNCNCFNLRSHKGNWIFFVTESNSDMKAFWCVWSLFKFRILMGTCPRLLYYCFYALFKCLDAY